MNLVVCELLLHFVVTMQVVIVKTAIAVEANHDIHTAKPDWLSETY